MNRKYLTIGEVSKIKKISIKSLRYYEHIGILVPVKINPDNGYRYYSTEQLLTIDMIKFLTEMDIPLKEWHHYISISSGFRLKELIEDSKKLTNQQIEMLKARLNKLEIAERGLKDHEKYHEYQGYYERRICQRNIMCYPMSDPDSPVDFHKKLSLLFELAKECHATANYPSGILLDYTPDGQRFYAFLEIYERLDGNPLFRHLPEHTYCCIRKAQKSIVHAADDVPEYFEQHPYATVIESDCIVSPVEFKPYPTELQFYYSVGKEKFFPLSHGENAKLSGGEI